MGNTPMLNKNLAIRVISSLFMLVGLWSVLTVGGYYITSVLVLLTVIMLSELLIMFKRSQHQGLVAPVSLILIFGFYICISMITWNAIYIKSGMNAIVWLVLLVAANDSGAYFVGKTLKGPKLVPSISPGKTWAGFFGGIIIGTTVAYIAAPYLIGVIENKFILNSIGFFLICLCLSLFSHLGDLFESAIKRFYGVKDSGSLIPGHGGVLDRMDSYLITSLLARFLFF
jgi:phosphatidate cytidylyltransferase